MLQLITVLCLVFAGAILSAAAPESPASPKAPSAPKEGAKPEASGDIVYVPSVFTDASSDPQFGKDVFFPNTTRFKKKAEAAPSQTPVQQGENALLQSLVLKGVSGTGARRFALLNNRTLGVGEVWDYKMNGQTYRIRCEEIKPRSVLISIEGVPETKEIQLRGNL